VWYVWIAHDGPWRVLLGTVIFFAIDLWTAEIWPQTWVRSSLRAGINVMFHGLPSWPWRFLSS
jgi:hypothetical protein